MTTLLEFATDNVLTPLLVKERAKYLGRNRSDKHDTLNKRDDLFSLTPRKMLSRMMPPRKTWVHPSNRMRKDNDGKEQKLSHRKLAEKAILLTIKRDRKRQTEDGITYSYLNEMCRFMDRIRERLTADTIQFETPQLKPIYKDLDDEALEVTCRPLTVYSQLEDKIIIALTSRYLTKYFDRYLHENILSYRKVRTVDGKKHYVTDFNDGVQKIKAFLEAHYDAPIYAFDCDIKKFYDTIPHNVVKACISRHLNQSQLSDQGKVQVLKVIDAYLNSYNFYTNAKEKSEQDDSVFSKVRQRLKDKEKNYTYKLKWVREIEALSVEDQLGLGVSQGGALSLLVANIVLNDVDKAITSTPDDNRLFIRYCDDMILLHTDYNECCRLKDLYIQSLQEHGLYYHGFEHVTAPNADDENPRKHFWKIKSHEPFLWDDGDDNANRYIGFLGYEIRRNGRIRLRKSNISRIAEKFRRQQYALRRYRKNHTTDEFLKRQKEALDKIMDSVDYYKGLDLSMFKLGAQYRYLKQLRKKTMSKLNI